MSCDEYLLLLLLYIFFRFGFVFVSNHNFPIGLFPSILTNGPLQLREGFCDKRVSNWFIFPLCMHCLSRYEALRKFREESTSIKSQNDRPSPEIPHENHASL